MPTIISKSAFAVRCGKSASAVSLWRARGILTGDAFTADGRVNVEEAERQLAERLDHSRSIGKMAGLPSLRAPVIASNPLAAIKLEREQRELQRLREQDEERRGRYVLTDAIRREHTRELVQFITMVEQRLPELVALLEGQSGKTAVVAARRWWRSLRQAEAVAAKARAEMAPRFDIDQPGGIVRPMEAAHAA